MEAKVSWPGSADARVERARAPLNAVNAARKVMPIRNISRLTFILFSFGRSFQPETILSPETARCKGASLAYFQTRFSRPLRLPAADALVWSREKGVIEMYPFLTAQLSVFSGPA